MGESFHHYQNQLQQQQQQQQPTTGRQTGSSRLGLRNSGCGEIVEVQGGHIVRSTGRKDRHSKVCTAKGPRDRRVRLSAPTAIQFYDVQDRLGYDRPSKAVDWLIKKAKSAIDELAELPAWNPTTTTTVSTAAANTSFFEQDQQKNPPENIQNQHQQQQHLGIHHGGVVGSSSKRAMPIMLGNENAANPSGNSSSFLPPSLDSDSIADTIKSFFPMGASTEANSSAMQFQSFPPPDLLSRTSSHSQDLRLSLQSFQDPILLHHHHHNQLAQHHPSNHTEQQAHPLFSGNAQMGYDASGWSEHQQPAELGRFQRMGVWNAGGDGGGTGAGGGGGYLFNSQAAPQPFLQQLFGQNQLFSQRGPLQSSNTPSFRAWMDPSAAISIATADHIPHHQAAVLPIYPSSVSGIGFASGVGGFSGFHIPARIQGEEEEHDGISDKPSSASSDSRH
ncbi:hypothetical protein ACH5RR_028133 [Cinchona calisaya]|uniref:TCP domain-containing protein n=1 Tax=Cinchona calisaya TaxID=153742 RepID=A0ABD2YR66_9GENT